MIDPVEVLKERLASDGITQTAMAAKIGVSRAYMSYLVNGERPISRKVLDYLGLEKAIVYRPKAMKRVK